MPVVELLGHSFFAGRLEDLRSVVEDAVEQGRKLHIVTVNPEMLMLRDPRFLEVLASAELRLPDGMGVVWASRLLRRGVLQRLPGIEVAEAIMAWGSERGWGFYFLGAREGVVQQAVQAMQHRYPSLKVCGCHHGYFTDDTEVVEDIKRTAPEVLFVGMGVPKQELWIARYREVLPVRVFMGVGGSFDVWAGRLPRAPLFFRSLGLEWLWRLFLEPRRIRRVVPAFFRFGLRLLREKWWGWYNTG